MIIEIPKFHETFNPILEVLSNGETIHTRELQKLVIEKYFSQLNEEQLAEKTKSGENLVKNRIAWGKSYLKKGGYIYYPERGNVKITDKGLKQKSDLSLKNVVEDSGILNFYSEENLKTNSKKNDLKEITNSSPQDLIDTGFSQIEKEVKNELLEKLKTIDPYYFEKVILILLKKMGYGDFIETSKSSDGGIDGIINEDKLGLEKIYIQAKRFTENKVREKDIRNFIGAMSGDTNKGVFVTTSFFDKGAVEKAKNAHHKIILIDGIKLVDLMLECKLKLFMKSNNLMKISLKKNKFQIIFFTRTSETSHYHKTVEGNVGQINKNCILIVSNDSINYENSIQNPTCSSVLFVKTINSNYFYEYERDASTRTKIAFKFNSIETLIPLNPHEG